MAQPTSFRLEYLGAIEVKANKEYTASAIVNMFTGSNVFILKSKATSNNPIKVSINKTVAFPVEYNEINAFDGTSSLSYVFNQNCIITICKDLEVV